MQTKIGMQMVIEVTQRERLNGSPDPSLEQMVGSVIIVKEKGIS